MFFCKDQKVSYTKMLHCLRNDSLSKLIHVRFAQYCSMKSEEKSIQAISAQAHGEAADNMCSQNTQDAMHL